MGVKVVSTANPAREVFGGVISVKAQQASVGYTSKLESVAAPSITFDLLPGLAGSIVPASLMFTFGGKTYIDRSGIIYTDVSSVTNAGIAVGTVDYDDRSVTLSSFPSGVAPTLQLIACLVTAPGFSTTFAYFRTRGAPIRPSSLQITAVRADTAEIVTATSDLNGKINNGIIKGVVDHTTGIVQLRFTTDLLDLSGDSEVQIIPNLLRYNAVVQTLLPLDANLLGLDPVRLPADGRVPIYREGDVAVLHHTAKAEVANPVAGGTLALGRTEISFVEVKDSTGKTLDTTQYTVNKATGILTWKNPLLLQTATGTSLTLPLEVRNRVEHMALVTEVQITGDVSLSADAPWDMPIAGSYLSSALAWGDLQARLFGWFTQQTWITNTPNWSSQPVGGGTTAQYNSLAYPQIISNMGAIDGKWALVFTSSTSFNIVEQKLGVIGTGTVATDCSPINPMTNTPYFTIKKEGWGTGWAAANAVRFDTVACLGPLWAVRTTVSGKGTVDDDSIRLQIRGDSD